MKLSASMLASLRRLEDPEARRQLYVPPRTLEALKRRGLITQEGTLGASWWAPSRTGREVLKANQ